MGFDGLERWLKWLRALPILAENQDLLPTNNMVAQNHLKLQLQGIGCPLLASGLTKHAYDIHAYLQAKHSSV